MGGKKTPPRNAYFFFMMDFKRKSGRRFNGNKELAEAASPHWQNMSQKERKPYEEQAKLAKNDGAKYTSLGQKVDVLQRQEQERIAKETKIKEDINFTIESAVARKSIADLPFYIVHVNYFCYCSSANRYVPAEIAVCKFTLRNGVIPENVFHAAVEPGPLPLGYSFEARKHSEETHQMKIPDSDDSDNLSETIRNLIKFFETTMDNASSTALPPLYTIESNTDVAETVLRDLFTQYCYDETSLIIYPLEYMFFKLRNAINEETPYPTISLVRLELEKDIYDFCRHIPCVTHAVSDVKNYCSRSYVIRLAFIICDNCCGDLMIDLIPGQHIPFESVVSRSRPTSRGWSAAMSTVSSDHDVNRFELLDIDSGDDSENNATQNSGWVQPKQRRRGKKTSNTSECSSTSTKSVKKLSAGTEEKQKLRLPRHVSAGMKDSLTHDHSVSCASTVTPRAASPTGSELSEMSNLSIRQSAPAKRTGPLSAFGRGRGRGSVNFQ